MGNSRVRAWKRPCGQGRRDAVLMGSDSTGGCCARALRPGMTRLCTCAMTAWGRPSSGRSVWLCSLLGFSLWVSLVGAGACLLGSANGTRWARSGFSTSALCRKSGRASDAMPSLILMLLGSDRSGTRPRRLSTRDLCRTPAKPMCGRSWNLLSPRCSTSRDTPRDTAAEVFG